MRVLTWNIERKRPRSWQGQELSRRIASAEPELICLTEAYEASLADCGGYSISTAGVVWSPVREGERKVLLWSREAWEEPDPIDAKAVAAGACISAVTRTSIGRVRVVGVCMPYRFAAPLGMHPKPKVWTQMIAFLDAFAPVLAAMRSRGLPTILIGDFNQFLPRIGGSKAAEAALAEVMRDMVVATEGPIPVVGRPAIDHVVHTKDLRSSNLVGLDHHMPDGRRISDHFGLTVELHPS